MFTEGCNIFTLNSEYSNVQFLKEKPKGSIKECIDWTNVETLNDINLSNLDQFLGHPHPTTADRYILTVRSNIPGYGQVTGKWVVPRL